MRGTLGEDVGDRVLEQATYALSDPEDYVRDGNLGLEDLFSEMTEEGLEQRPQTQEMGSGVMNQFLMFRTTTITSCSRTT